MSETTANDDIVTIDGKQYNRLMAEEMARDIELLASIQPQSWAIGDNSGIRVGRTVALSFALPVDHGYLVDPGALGPDGLELVQRFGQSANSKPLPELIHVYLADWSEQALRELRPGHEQALRKLAETYTGIAPAWKWFNPARFRDLEAVVGRTLPAPGYHDRFLEHRLNEPDVIDLSKSDQPGGNPDDLLPYIADAIEAAHAINPSSWSIYNQKSGVVLKVSGYSVAFIASERGDWMLYGNPDEDRYASLSGYRLNTNFEPPVFRVLVDERWQLLEIAETFHESFLEAVRDLAARTRTVTPRAAEFQPRVLERVAHVTGRDLPQPAYPTQSTSALPGREANPNVHIEHVEGRRYWKVDCGSNGVEFPDMIALGRVWWSNWSSEPVYLDQLPKDHDAFVAAIIQYQGIAGPAAEHCWRFMHEMSVGDLMVAISKNRSYGWGEVAGDYEYVEEEKKQHQRAAEWTELTPPYLIANMSQSLKDATWGFGPRELTFEQFAEAIGSPSADNVTPAPMHDALVSGLPKPLLQQLAADIELAHSINPRSWWLRRDGDDIVLQVQKTHQFALGGNQGVASLSGVLEDPGLIEIRPNLKLGQELHQHYFQVQPLEKFEEFLANYGALHRQAIEEAARGVRTHVARHHLHDQGLVDAIARRLGIELPAPAYWNRNSVTRRLVIDSQSDLDPLPAIRSAFAANGLTYTKAQIATFYTALQTKGFVVLSGISGTGKSKIATGFVEMLPDSAETEVILPPDDDRIVILIKPYMKNHHNIHIPKQYHSRFPRPTEKRVIKDIPIQVGHVHGTGRLSYDGATLKRAITLTMYESLFPVMQALVEDEPYALSLDLNDERDEVVALRLLPLDESDEQSIHQRSNHLFLSVRPDWRDSTSLLGYYNPLTETYEWTEFLKFLIRAGENYQGPAEDRIAWFVILDEMNLAHVEYYFADLLSVLESGRDENGWTKEALRLTFPDTLDDAPPDTVYLPPNLYIIGTVNMDETTHAFSPKVLDRAFTIELTDVDFASYDLGGGNGAAATLTEGEQAALLRAFSRNGRFVRIDKGEIADVIAPNRHPEVRARLQALNMLLRRDRFHFGYRVFDEIGQYLAINDEHGMMPFHEAFDWAVMMKVLPKFSGSAARLRSPLRSVLAWAFHPTAAPESWKSVVASFATLLGEDQPDLDDFVKEAAYPVVAARAARMLLTLEQDGFVSFG